MASAACARDDGGASADDDGGEAPTADDGGDAGKATSLEEGGFGDLESVCQEGDAAGATAPGVTDDSITVGTITDKGGPVQGLNEEMYDTAVAFTKWCNEHGGILGRELVLSDVDAKLFEYEPAVTDACGRDFALVGGGAVFDEDPNDVRVKCKLPNIAGYVVSARGRTADLQVQPIPNAIYDVAMGRYNAAARDFPDGKDKYGIMASAIDSVLLVEQQSTEVAEAKGFKVAYQYDYQTINETGWANFVREMKDRDIKILEFIGQPQNLVELTNEMNVARWHPDTILLSTNFYDDLYRQAATTDANLYIQSAFYPLEMADENKATQDYLDLMDQYNPDGKIAQLGVQGLSSWLLFATAATECGSELTADCLLEKAAAQEDWTGAGLHARQDPGNDTPSPCFLILGLDEDGFFYNEEATQPTEGVFNCDEDNVFHLTGDYSKYGAPPPEGG
ncbi:MAG: ABC transporter substrate-binding protein [Acidimicrobiales bacterium]